MNALKLKILGGIAAGAVGAMAIGVWNQPASAPVQSPELTPSKSATASQSVAPVVGASLGCQIRPGILLSYNLSVDDRAKLRLAKTPTGAATDITELHEHTQAQLNLKAVSSAEDGTLMVGQFQKIEGRAIVSPDDVARPFLMRLTADCKVDGYAHHQDTPLPEARIQQALLHELQWQWPTEPNQRFQGENTAGEYEASVTLKPQAQGVLVERTIDRYRSWKTAPQAVTAVENSELKVRSTGSTWFDSLETQERLKTPLGTHDRSVLARRVTANSDVLSGVPDDESQYVWANLLSQNFEPAPLSGVTPRQRRERELASRQTFDQAVTAFVERATNPEVGIQDTWPPLQAFLEVKPEATTQLVDKIKNGELPNQAEMSAYMALGNAQTKEARQALLDVTNDDSAPVLHRSRAMLSLVGRSDVGPEYARQLSDWAEFIESGKTRSQRVLARQSMLALGAMAGRHPDDAQIQEVAMARIQQSLAQLSHPLHLRPVYGAMANIGQPALLQFISDIPNHPDAERREYAAIVMRRMPAASTGAFAGYWLDRETSWNVKREIYSTLELESFDFHEPAAPEVLQHAVRDLKAKPGVITRKALIRLIGRSLKLREKDDLGLEAALLDAVAYEVEKQTDLTMVIMEFVDADKYQEVRAKTRRVPTAPTAPTQPAADVLPTTAPKLGVVGP